VRGAEPRDTASENCNRIRHPGILHPHDGCQFVTWGERPVVRHNLETSRSHQIAQLWIRIQQLHALIFLATAFSGISRKWIAASRCRQLNAGIWSSAEPHIVSVALRRARSNGFRRCRRQADASTAHSAAGSTITGRGPRAGAPAPARADHDDAGDGQPGARSNCRPAAEQACVAVP